MAFVPDGHTLAAATAPFGARANGTVLWDLSGLEELRAHAMERACAITRGGLDRAEWGRYVPGLEYDDDV